MKKTSSYTVYILRCSDDTYYTGCTIDIEKRLREHNYRKSGAKYTKMRRPVILQYSETHETFTQMRSRELELKKWPRHKKETLWK